MATTKPRVFRIETTNDSGSCDDSEHDVIPGSEESEDGGINQAFSNLNVGGMFLNPSMIVSGGSARSRSKSNPNIKNKKFKKNQMFKDGNISDSSQREGSPFPFEDATEAIQLKQNETINKLLSIAIEIKETLDLNETESNDTNNNNGNNGLNYQFTIQIWTNYGTWQVTRKLSDMRKLSLNLAKVHSLNDIDLPKFPFDENYKEKQSNNNDSIVCAKIHSLNEIESLIETYLESLVRRKKVFVSKPVLTFIKAPQSIRNICKKLDEYLNEAIKSGWVSCSDMIVQTMSLSATNTPVASVDTSNLSTLSVDPTNNNIIQTPHTPGAPSSSSHTIHELTISDNIHHCDHMSVASRRDANFRQHNQNSSFRSKKRFCVLQYDYTLNFYHSEQALRMNNQPPLQRIDLINGKCVINYKQDIKFGIETTNRLWIFKCNNDKDKNQWINSIDAMIYGNSGYQPYFKPCEKIDFEGMMSLSDVDSMNENMNDSMNMRRKMNKKKHNRGNHHSNNNGKNKLKGSDFTISMLKTRVKDLECAMNQLTTEKQNVNESCNDYESLINDLTNENNRLQSQFKQLSLKLNNFQSKYNNSIESFDKLKNEYESKEDKITELNDNLTQYQSKNKLLTQEMTNLSDLNNNCIIETQDIADKVSNVMNEMTEYDNIYNSIIDGELYKFEGKSLNHMKINKEAKKKFVTFIPIQRSLVYSSNLKSIDTKKIEIMDISLDNDKIAKAVGRYNVSKKYENRWFIVYGTDRVLIFATKTKEDLLRWYHTIKNSLQNNFSNAKQNKECQIALARQSLMDLVSVAKNDTNGITRQNTANPWQLHINNNNFNQFNGNGNDLQRNRLRSLSVNNVIMHSQSQSSQGSPNSQNEQSDQKTEEIDKN